MRRRIITTILTIIALAAAGHGYGRDLSQPADILFKAFQNKDKIPVLSLQFPDLDEPAAYNVQKAFVEKCIEASNCTTAGFKAGLTSPPAMERFGRKTPVAGVLLASGDMTGALKIKLTDYRVLMMETEIGFIIEKAITKRLIDTAELKGHIRYAVPVIELPEMGFSDMKAIKGPDIIAANVGAAGFIRGERKEIDGLDLNAVDVILSRNGEVVNCGKGSDALGSQWQALLWLVNTMIETGWEIKPGHLLITGVLGKMIPAKPGKYTADYGPFGLVLVEIK